MLIKWFPKAWKWNRLFSFRFWPVNLN